MKKIKLKQNNDLFVIFNIYLIYPQDTVALFPTTKCDSPYWLFIIIYP